VIDASIAESGWRGAALSAIFFKHQNLMTVVGILIATSCWALYLLNLGGRIDYSWSGIDGLFSSAACRLQTG